MYRMNKVCIIGGDYRMYCLGSQLSECGASVTYWGFDKLVQGDGNFIVLDQAIERCDSVVLPVPLTRDGKSINAPLSSAAAMLDQELAGKLAGKRIFTSNAEVLMSSGDYDRADVYDYYDCEPLMIENAILTAEGAVGTVIEMSEKSLYSSRCLVTGWGRIAKPLCRILRSIGAEVTAAVRSENDMTWISAEGIAPMRISEIDHIDNYDYIFNTVPHMIFTRRILENAAPDTLVIDLSSMPGGVDKEACSELGIQYVHALSLPGKIAPKAAAAVIKKSLMRIISDPPHQKPDSALSDTTKQYYEEESKWKEPQ